MISTFEIDDITCQKLETPVYQLALILYPAELANEKFLIKVRNCIVKLNEGHPLKKWMTYLSKREKPTAEQQKKIDFLEELLLSPFNLITDHKTKKKVIELIGEMTGQTNVERLLRSYLYLLIGNITHSDNILKNLMSESPRQFYQWYELHGSIFHKVAISHLDDILKKMARHPADRLVFNLFGMYLSIYTNREDLKELLNEIRDDDFTNKLSLSYTERIAPELVFIAQLIRLENKARIHKLRMNKFTFEMQGYWIWPFLDVELLLDERMIEQLKKLAEADPVWASFILDNEKISDLYLSRGGKSLTKSRGELRELLKNEGDFMLTLYKLIEFGDIDSRLVHDVEAFLMKDFSL